MDLAFWKDMAGCWTTISTQEEKKKIHSAMRGLVQNNVSKRQCERSMADELMDEED